MTQFLAWLTPNVVLALAAFAFIAVMGVIYWVASLHPAISVTLGAAFLAVPAAELAFLDRSHFQSDGSAAGLVIFLAAAAVGIFCGSVGLTLLAKGISRFAAGEPASRFSRRALAVFGGLVAMGLLAAMGWRYEEERARTPLFESALEDRHADRPIELRERYAFTWKRQGLVPALGLSVPVHELADGAQSGARLLHTRDGPRTVQLLVADADAGYARLTVNRDDSTVEPNVAAALHANRTPADPAMPRALWIERGEGSWSLRGIECGPQSLERYPALANAALAQRGVRCFKPDAPLARVLPGPFGLERLPLHADWNPRSTQATCKVSFRFRDRVATVSKEGRCFEVPTLGALAAAVQRIGYAAADGETAPGPAARLARARLAVEACERARADLEAKADRKQASLRGQFPEGLQAACAQAVRAAGAELKPSPAEAGAFLVRAIDAQGDAPGRPPDELIEDMVAAVGASGEGGARAALAVHALRLERLGGSTDPQRRALVQASLRTVVPLAPELLAAEDPLFEKVEQAVARASLDEEDRLRHIALLQAWQDKALDPASDVALKARFRACLRRWQANLQRETLNACADGLFAQWQSRAGSGGSFAPFYNEAELAFAVAGMYYSWAYAAPDFAAGVAALQRVRAFAAQRFAADARHAPMLARMDGLEEELAAKASPRSARAR